MYVALLANRPGRNQDSLNFHIKSSSISWSGVFLSFCCWCERAVSQLSSPWSLTPLTVITLFQVFSAVTELQSKNGGERGVQHTFMASVWSMWAHYDHQFGTTKRKKNTLKWWKRVCDSSWVSVGTAVVFLLKNPVLSSSLVMQTSRWKGDLCLLLIFIYQSCLDDNVFVGRPLLHASSLANSPSGRWNQASSSETGRD